VVPPGAAGCGGARGGGGIDSGVEGSVRGRRGWEYKTEVESKINLSWERGWRQIGGDLNAELPALTVMEEAGARHGAEEGGRRVPDDRRGFERRRRSGRRGIRAGRRRRAEESRRRMIEGGRGWCADPRDWGRG
jgi:hypothetical protein